MNFDDVLLKPKRSTLTSRSKVNLTRIHKFKHSTKTFEGVPLIAANMDGVGEIEVAKKLSSYKLLTALTKQHEIKDIKNI